MSSYIPSNAVEMLPKNYLLINNKHIVYGILTQHKDEWIYTFKPFSGLPVDEEKDCVNDIAVYLSEKLKKIENKTYASYSHYDHNKGCWYINFTYVGNKK